MIQSFLCGQSKRIALKVFHGEGRLLDGLGEGELTRDEARSILFKGQVYWTLYEFSEYNS